MSAIAYRLARTALPPDRKPPSPFIVALAWSLIASVPALVSLMPTDSFGDAPGTAALTSAAFNDEQVQTRPSAATATALSGTWTYASGSAGRQRIQDGIDEATEGMVIGREIARSRLSKEIQPEMTVELQVKDSKVSLRMDTMSIRDAELGKWVNWSHEGTDYEVRFTMTEAGDLVQDIRSKDCKIRRRFRARDGKLKLRFKMDHDQLADDLKYWLAYE